MASLDEELPIVALTPKHWQDWDSHEGSDRTENMIYHFLTHIKSCLSLNVINNDGDYADSGSARTY